VERPPISVSASGRAGRLEIAADFVDQSETHLVGDRLVIEYPFLLLCDGYRLAQVIVHLPMGIWLF
jgi:hypothetical protein